MIQKIVKRNGYKQDGNVERIFLNESIQIKGRERKRIRD